MMSSESMLKEINRGLVALDMDKVLKLVKDALNLKLDPVAILEALRSGMEEVGRKFETQEYFLSDLIMAGEMMKESLKVLKPHLKLSGEGKGKVVLGTIIGDLHDIGKDIVKTLLISSGMEVFDLGVDVSPEEYVDKAIEVEADVIGVSALLSTTVPTSGEVVNLLRRKGVRDKMKVIVGGAAVRKRYEQELGVDAAVNDAIVGLNIIKSWIGSKS